MGSEGTDRLAGPIASVPSPPPPLRRSWVETYTPPSPEIDWRRAAELQRQRRAAATRAERAPDVTTIKEGGASTFFVARARRETEDQRARAADPVEAAATLLRRRDRRVNRASVFGGRKDRWVVSGLGTSVTDAELIAEAERVQSGRPREEDWA